MTTALPDVDDPTDFDSLALSTLDTSLRCQICHELFVAPVLLTTCSHTFDSLCVRTHLRDVKKCPQCQHEANEAHIRRNLQVEEMVRAWKVARPILLEQQRRLEALSSSTASSPVPPPIASTSRQPASAPAPASVDRSRSTAQKGKRKATATSNATEAVRTKRTKPVQDANARARSPAGSPGEIVVENDAERTTCDDDRSSDVEVVDDPGPVRKRPKRGEHPGASSRQEIDRVGETNRLAEGKGKGKDPSEAEADPTNPSVVVSCPLCSRLVRNGSISPHIDSGCTKFVVAGSDRSVAKGKERKKSTRTGKGDAFSRMMSGGGGDKATDSDNEPEFDTTKYQPLPNYAFKKLRDLEKMLKELKLPLTVPASWSSSLISSTSSSVSSTTTTIPNDAKLRCYRRRHSQYLTLWNANADIDPKDPAHKAPRELRKDLERWEGVLEKEEKAKDKDKVKNGSRHAREATSGEGGSSAKKNDSAKGRSGDDFRSLIAQARASAMRDRENQRKDTQDGETTICPRDRADHVGAVEEEDATTARNEGATRGDDAIRMSSPTSGHGPGGDATIRSSDDATDDTAGPTLRREDRRHVRIVSPDDRSSRTEQSPKRDASPRSSTLTPVAHKPSSSSSSSPSGELRARDDLSSPSPSESQKLSYDRARGDVHDERRMAGGEKREDDDDGDHKEEEEEEEEESSDAMPRPSQRVREVDWEMVRRAARDDDDDEGEDEDDDVD
ncbi:hypothetical protein JCM10212_006545 [Sporobolomyces blumeae]